MHLDCPHCHNPIEVVEEPQPAEVVCPSCGSSFELEPATRTGPVERKLDRFVIVDTVGLGAFGRVYLARDPELDREVAIKVPRSGNFLRRRKQPVFAILDRLYNH